MNAFLQRMKWRKTSLKFSKNQFLNRIMYALSSSFFIKKTQYFNQIKYLIPQRLPTYFSYYKPYF